MPLAGSHPTAAEKPCGHITPVVQSWSKQSPFVISFVNDAEWVYRTGLIQPSDPFPTACRAALTLESKAAATGAVNEVPENISGLP